MSRSGNPIIINIVLVLSCEAPETLQHADVVHGNLNFSSNATYTCHSGYQVTNTMEQTSQCVFNVMCEVHWTPVLPCERMYPS